MTSRLADGVDGFALGVIPNDTSRVILQVLSIVVVGFVGSAEFGSWAFVHPVIRTLPEREWLRVEKGLLKTFGRFMPFGMTAAPILAGMVTRGLTGTARTLGGLAAVSLVIALVTTVLVNVRINLATGKWDPENPPPNWRQERAKWERFQGIRASLQLLGFVLLSAALLYE